MFDSALYSSILHTVREKRITSFRYLLVYYGYDSRAIDLINGHKDYILFLINENRCDARLDPLNLMAPER